LYTFEALESNHYEPISIEFFVEFLEIYRNNLKNREFGKEEPQNFCSERETIAKRQGSSKNRNFEEMPTPPKTDSSGCFGIGSSIEAIHLLKKLDKSIDLRRIYPYGEAESGTFLAK